jgi:hypothetical protein
LITTTPAAALQARDQLLVAQQVQGNFRVKCMCSAEGGAHHEQHTGDALLPVLLRVFSSNASKALAADITIL